MSVTWQDVIDLESDLREQAALETETPAAEPLPGAGYLGLTDPEAWDWPGLRGLVAQRGRHQLFHLAKRYRAAAATLAGRHGLTLVIHSDARAELVPAQQAQPDRSFVGHRGPYNREGRR